MNLRLKYEMKNSNKREKKYIINKEIMKIK